MYKKFTRSALTSFVFGFILSMLIIGVSSAARNVETYEPFSSDESSLSFYGDSLSQTIACEEPLDAWHAHGYENTTKPDEGYESYFVAHKLRIYLHDDFMQSVNLSTLECTVPYGGKESDGVNDGLVPCNGGSSTSYGGVEVKLVQNDNSADAVYPDYVEWNYGMDDASGKPLIPGFNDYDGDGDTEDEGDDRDMAEAVYWQFKDGQAFGSATTTSSLYVQFWIFDQNCGDYGDSSCWSASVEDGTAEKHWNDNDTFTNYTEYTCDKPECQSLTMDINSENIGVDDLGSAFISINTQVTDTSGADITADSEINWKAFSYQETQPDFGDTANANGDFRYGLWDSLGRMNDLITKATKEISYFNQSAGDWILAKVDGSAPGVCEAAIQLPYCVNLDITSPSIVMPTSAPSSQEISIDVEASTGEDWPYTIEWDSTDENSLFDGNTPPYQSDLASGGWNVTYESSESSQIDVKALDDVAGFCSASINLTITQAAICESLSIGDPYFADGSSFDPNNQDDVARLDGNEIMCWNFELNVPTGDPLYTPSLSAYAYESNGGALTTDSIEISVDAGPSASGSGSASVNLNGLPIYTGSICWTGFEENEYLDAFVEGEATYCSAEYEFSFESGGACVDEDGDGIDDNTGEICEDEPGNPGGGGGNGGGSGGGSGSGGVEGDNGGNSGDIDNKENGEIGKFDKFIYTFNFSPEQDGNDFYDTFFTHNADRAFYTLDYIPNGSESELYFTDGLWSSAGTQSDLGGSLIFVTDATMLSADIDKDNDVDQYGVYRYELIERMGFDSKEFDENADKIGDDIQNGAFAPVIPYLTFEDGKKAVRIEDCIYDAEGAEVSGEICVDNLENTLEYEGAVRLLNLDDFAQEYANEIEDGNIRIRLRYVAIVNNALDCSNGSDPCLTEKFVNEAEVTVNGGESAQAEAMLASLCQYLVTRNAGDVFLEQQIDGGSDIACIYDGSEFDVEDYRNVDSLVVYDDEKEQSEEDETIINYDYEESEGVSYSSGYSEFSVSFCDDTESNTGGIIANLSSYVCEIVVSVADLWKSSTVESTTSSQISQAVRNAETRQSTLNGTVSSWETLVNALSNNNNPESGVLYYQGSGESLTLGNLNVPNGAWTLIVTNADLHITGNILYEDAGAGTDYRNLPSFAIIVEGGDIDISANVSEINAFMVTDQKFTGEARSEVDQQLVIRGSLYGNVQELFNSARYVGSPSTNIPGGGLVIYYDETIILNTPPYLNEKVDIYSEETVN